MNKILDQSFFDRPVLEVSEDLIGKNLVREFNKNGIKCLIKAQITEVEAYDGPNDLACHASKGETPRTKIMFGPAGYFYVYLCYGIHWMLNIVTGPKGYPAAILIRGLKNISGPARLTKSLKINRSMNSKLAHPDSGLWIEDPGITIAKNKIRNTPRIGVEYAGQIWSKKNYRFVLKD